MSKSTRHFILAKEALERFSPNAIRLYFLQSHYRSQIEFDNQRLEAAESGWARIKSFLGQVEERLSNETVIPEPALDDFRRAMDDDLNTCQALGSIFESVAQGFKILETGGSPVEQYASVRRSLEQLGFSGAMQEASTNQQGLVDLIVETRNRLRTKGEYELADDIRKKLTELGIKVEDTKKGTRTIL